MLSGSVPLTVFDVRAEQVRAVVAEGAAPARSPAEVAARSDVVLLSLPTSREVEQVALGADGEHRGARLAERRRPFERRPVRVSNPPQPCYTRPMPHQTPPLAEHSILSLVQNHTLDVSLAALLWALVARRGSLVVASPPQFAGKTTLLHAVLDLQPRDTRVVVARGADEDYAFLAEADPSTTTILVPEFSDHLPAYTWGDRTPPVFDAMGRGYAMGATMHAASAEEVLGQLATPPNDVSPRQIGRLHAIVTIAVWSDGADYVRRVHTLSVVGPTVPRRGLPACRPVAWWEQARDAWRVVRGASVLAARLGLDGDAWERELAWRRGVLRRLLEQGIVEPERVRQEAWRARPPE